MLAGRSIRAFLAVEVPPESLDVSGIEWLRAGYLRSVKEDQRHVTLVFMGSAHVDKMRGLAESLSSFSFPTFRVHMKGISTFSKRPRVIFADIEEGRDELKSLSERLSSAVKEAGISIDERDFEPHVTIARVKDMAHSEEILKNINEHSGHDFGEFECIEIKLKESALKPEGPEYTDLLTIRASGPF